MNGYELFHRHRRLVAVAADLSVIVLANFLGFWLRFEGMIPQRTWDLFVSMLPWLLVMRGLAFISFRLYEGLWCYTSIKDLWHIIRAVGLSSIAFYGLVHWILGYTDYPRSVFVIDAILLIVFLGGMRMARRLYREMWPKNRGKRLLVYGAGDAGEMIVRDIMQRTDSGYSPIGFVDDDPTKIGQRIHGFPILGGGESLPKIIRRHGPDVLLIAIPRLKPAILRKIVKQIGSFHLPVKTLPNIREFQDLTVTVHRIRSLSIEDLLERAPVPLDLVPIRELIRGKRVLITGAGGSIGSELCRQILTHGAASLVLYERYENGLQAIVSELTAQAKEKNITVLPVIGDVSDQNRVEEIFLKHAPDLVLHAAAYKHVPLMELCPCEAVKNNIMGTRIMAETARRTGVKRFILISTDKAVNPTSIMGVTKRVAEMTIQMMAQSNDDVLFTAVRFGNVLGSSGSAVPHFIEQIKAGGPITVTDPAMQRFFMLISEAVQLVLYAATMARSGDICVLEMGEPIKVLELVHNLIRLAGFSLEDIPIEIIGIRPGEKLYEELVGQDEIVEWSNVKGIFCVRFRENARPIVLDQQIRMLERQAQCGDAEGVIKLLREIVPLYGPSAEKSGGVAGLNNYV